MKLATTLVMMLASLASVQGQSLNQVQRNSIDFSQAVQDPKTGQLCVMQPVCISDPAALSRLLPSEPCLSEGCTCSTDADCGGGDAKCVACNCKECPLSAAVSASVINPPLTFVIDTTKSVKPDKDSIFNLTQRVVSRIQDTNVNVPQFLLVTFNDFGPDIRQNVFTFPPTKDVLRFKEDILNLVFESFDGGRDSKERLMQGLLVACREAPAKSLVVVFTDNGSKDLELKGEILRLKQERELTIYLVLTPVYEGWPNDRSLQVFGELAKVFFISEVGADVFLSSVEEFEESNCI